MKDTNYGAKYGIDQTKRVCYNCIYYYESTMCGYNAASCYKHGSLDIDQKQRNPETSAAMCKYYKNRKELQNDYIK